MTTLNELLREIAGPVTVYAAEETMEAATSTVTDSGEYDQYEGTSTEDAYTGSAAGSAADTTMAAGATESLVQEKADETAAALEEAEAEEASSEEGGEEEAAGEEGMAEEETAGDEMTADEGMADEGMMDEGMMGDGMMTETGPQMSLLDKVLTSKTNIAGVSCGTLVIGCLIGFILAKIRIKKGVDPYEDN